jgi:hypothetical protein
MLIYNGWDYSSCECAVRILTREPDAGNLHVRFDEGEGDAWKNGMRLLRHIRGNPETD